MENINYYSHTCKCGCGGQIEIKSYHKNKKIPLYTPNHHRKGVKNKKSSTKKTHKIERNKIAKFLIENRNKHFCQCGCNQKIIIKFRRNRKGRYLRISLKFIDRHQSRITNRRLTTKNKLSKALKQFWSDEKNKNRLVENNPMLQKGKKLTEEHKNKIGEGNKGKIHSENQNLFFSRAIKNLWQNPEYIKKQMKARKVLQNKAEKSLHKIINSITKSFTFVGDGKEIVGSKCPDFIDKANNKIIELYGDYWHKGQDPNDRINYFKNYGYNTLVIWEHELKDIYSLKNRIGGFIYELSGL